MKTWFITGAARGLGAYIAEQALQAGDNVVAAARDPGAVAMRFGDRANLLAARLDVTQPTEAASAVQAALDRFGAIDVLVNNAGYGLVGAVEEARASEIEQLFSVNVFGLLAVTRAVLPSMRARRRGHVINMSSIGGYRGAAGFGVYCATKFAVEGLSEAMQAELAPLGVHVTVVEPGYFRTDFLDPASLKISASSINDYEQTVGAVRARVGGLNHQQPGDPVKLAQAIMGLVSGQAGYVPKMDNPDDIKQAFEDLIFAGHYYMLRELLYYSYNARGAVDWRFGEGTIDLRYADRSIPRQFFTVFNDMVLGSADLFKSFDEDREKIRQLLANEPEGVETPNMLAAGELIGREVELKLSAYFSLLAPDSDIDLGGYRYRDFLKLYSGLTAKALYHRYLARDRDAIGAIYMPEASLVAEAAADLEAPVAVVRAILADIVFDKAAAADRLDGSYFSLLREDGSDGRIIMRPHHFAADEGLVNLLRVVAQRRPETFLQSVSNPLGAAFVQHVKRSWEAQGFTCHAEVSLRDIDPTLPDVDLIVVSEEPTLGYVIFVCELKAPVPPKWAKDQLKVLNKDSVSKAFRQTDALRTFLATRGGAEFLARIVPRQHPYFEDFVVTVQHLIITSDNGGMFFGDENTKIINYRTLGRLLGRSDGDMALIQHVLATYNEEADKAVVTASNEVAVGATTVKASPKNVRRVGHSAEVIESRAASITYKGVLQPLVVEPEIKDGRETGYYLVSAGEGRLLNLI